MRKYAQAVAAIGAMLWVAGAAAQGTVMKGDSSGAARKPGTEGAVGTAGASAAKSGAPRAAGPASGVAPQTDRSMGSGTHGNLPSSAASGTAPSPLKD